MKDKRPHKVMTPAEYDSMLIQGWHEVCRDVDGCGNVGVRFCTDFRTTLVRAERHVRDLASKLGADEDEVDAATEYLRTAVVLEMQE